MYYYAYFSYYYACISNPYIVSLSMNFLGTPYHIMSLFEND
jgi:hypothetical protein